VLNGTLGGVRGSDDTYSIVFLRLSLVRYCPAVVLARPHPARAQRLDSWPCWGWLSVSSCAHDPQPLRLWSCLPWCMAMRVWSVLSVAVVLCPVRVMSILLHEGRAHDLIYNTMFV
ncbi:hypothetical protein, partial [Faecalibaculum rodentium]|uniref:hypothetical protein n=1 Tax=Faecalibaculum rodentium TaxID=1702221 RepID=UPI0025A00FE8